MPEVYLVTYKKAMVSTYLVVEKAPFCLCQQPYTVRKSVVLEAIPNFSVVPVALLSFLKIVNISLVCTFQWN